MTMVLSILTCKLFRLLLREKGGRFTCQYNHTHISRVLISFWVGVCQGKKRTFAAFERLNNTLGWEHTMKLQTLFFHQLKSEPKFNMPLGIIHTLLPGGMGGWEGGQGPIWVLSKRHVLIYIYSFERTKYTSHYSWHFHKYLKCPLTVTFTSC